MRYLVAFALLNCCISIEFYNLDFNRSFGTVSSLYDKMLSLPAKSFDYKGLEKVGGGFFGRVYALGDDKVLKVSAFFPEIFQARELSEPTLRQLLNRMEVFPRDKGIWIERFREPGNIIMVQERLTEEELSRITLPSEIYFDPKKVVLFSVMERNDYTLYTYLKKIRATDNSLDFRQRNRKNIASILYSCVSTVSFINRAGFVNYDIKLNNFMADKDGKFKMIDIGKNLKLHETAREPNFFPLIKFYNFGPEKFVNNLNRRSIGVDSWQIGLLLLEICTFEHYWIKAYIKKFKVIDEFVEKQDLTLTIVFDPLFDAKFRQLYEEECPFMQDYLKTDEFMSLFRRDPDERTTVTQLRKMLEERGAGEWFDFNQAKWE